MTKQELLHALAPFDDDTFIAVRFMSTDNKWFELAAFGIEYVGTAGDKDAYVAVRTYQKDGD